MGWYRIFPTKDTFISTYAPEGLSDVRATGSNHGKTPSLNIFAAKSRFSSSSVELARVLIDFNVAELSGKIYSDLVIPSSSVTYHLKMFDMKHDETIPTSYDLFVYPLSRSWDEGNGIDNDNFRDYGYANWMSASSTQGWTLTGSDFITDMGSGSQHFDSGDEDLSVDITHVVRNWLTGTFGKNGLVIKFGNAEETNVTDYYKKIFHGRASKYVDRIPYIEARWDNDIIKDNRKNFGFGVDNKLYMYNFKRGALVDATQPILVNVRDSMVVASSSYNAWLTASRVETGIYSASLNIVNTASFSGTFYDFWTSGSVVYMTGTFTPLVLTGSQTDVYDEFDIQVSNLKQKYRSDEEARLKVVVRKRDYKTHQYVHTASLGLPLEYIENMYYSIINDESGEEVVPFATGSVGYTKLSYNGDGNYMNLWMNSLVPGFVYKLLFLIDINKYDKKFIDQGFRFKVI